MRTITLGVIAVLTTSVVSTAPAAAIRLYFSTTGLDNQNLAAPPPEALTHVNPVVSIGGTVYLFAEVIDPGTWNGVGLNYSGADGAVTLIQQIVLSLPRWNGNSDFTGRLDGSDGTYLLAVQDQGLPNPYPLGMFDNYEAPGGSVPGAETFYLGSASPTAAGTVFLHVGSQGISRVGGDPNVDNVFFGWGDAAVHGNQFGRASDIEDLTITPEPANALILLAVLAAARIRK